jgi:hypothetical protein
MQYETESLKNAKSKIVASCVFIIYSRAMRYTLGQQYYANYDISSSSSRPKCFKPLGAYGSINSIYWLQWQQL